MKALYTILTSFGLALTFNYLFFDRWIGISVFVLAVILLGTVYLFGSRQNLPMKKTWWLAVLILFFALMPGIRSNELLVFLNICATFGLLMVLAYELTGTRAIFMKLSDYFFLMVLVPFQMLGRALSTLAAIGQIHSRAKNRNIWLRVIKGALMAVPVLVIFGVLFSKADLAFSQFINNFININITEHTVQYLILLIFAFTAALSFLSYIFFPVQFKPELTEKNDNKDGQAGKGIEVMVFLGLICALFLLFICFQITYLFGGETNIIDAGFTYAEYARRGFWELLAVGLLSLLVLFSSEKYAGIESKRDNRFLFPALILITEVGIVIFSAFKRLCLYTDAYGMTLPRFYGAGIIILLSVLFILLAIKFIRSKKEQFLAFGTLISVAGFIIVINLVNPDAFIANSNMEQYNKTGKIDLSYIRELSADAEYQKIELYNKLAGEDKILLGDLLRRDKENMLRSNDGWQSSNLSRTRALKLLQELGF
jgi:hypothetical protein